MTRWNIYMVQANGTMRLVGPMVCRNPDKRLRQIEREHRAAYPGDWTLVACAAATDRWDPRN